MRAELTMEDMVFGAGKVRSCLHFLAGDGRLAGR